MSFFTSLSKLFNGGSESTTPSTTIQSITTEEAAIPEMPANNAPRVQMPLTVSYATGWPIDVIYGYLHKNYEEKGYNDAMVQSDISFCEMNMNIIKNKILMVFNEINLNYDVMTYKIEKNIDSCKNVGLYGRIQDLENSLSIIKVHKEELRRLESDFRADSNEASVPLASYKCGFIRGIGILSMDNLGRTIPMPLPQPAASPYRMEAASKEVG